MHCLIINQTQKVSDIKEPKLDAATTFFYKNMKQELSEKGYSEFRYLGKGAQGYVILAKENKTNRRYAIKGIHIRDGEGNIDNNIKQQVQQEINLLNKCKGSPYVINLIDKIEGKEFIYLVLTECQGTLDDIIEKNQGKKLNELSAIKYSKDIAEGLYNFHSKECVINDLKMDNILIDYNGNAVVCKFFNTKKNSDFGFAQNLTKMSGYGMNEYMGNVLFVAPECIDSKQFEVYDEEYKKRGIKVATKPSQRVIIL